MTDRNVTAQAFSIAPADRAELMKQTPVVLWLTGLPGSGKSTLANAVDRLLYDEGLKTMVLDGDNVRGGLTSDLGFSPADRHENVRRVAEAARLIADSGVIVIVALVSPFEVDRAAARAIFSPEIFIEVFVDTPAELCSERDPKGLYKKARAGQITNMTGVGQSYEEPVKPELHVHGDADLGTTAKNVLQAILDRQK